MPTEFTVNEDVKTLIQEIIAKNDLKNISDIKYEAGSGKGDGYISKTVAVSIINGTENFKLFLKCALNVKSTEIMPIDKLYLNEIYFYDVVYPEYSKFLKELGIIDGLKFIPKYYGTDSKAIVALENLREKKFTNCDRARLMNDSHLTTVFKAFAKFHAITYAFKDQRRQIHDKLVENLFDFFSATRDSFKPYMEKVINEYLDTLDPEKDKYLIEKCDGLGEKLAIEMSAARGNINKYSTLTQGDSHCINMMFTYEDEKNESPTDMRLIDWQLVHEASPVYDLAYFFYPVASDEALDNINDYLEIYHEELSKWIKFLGSDPELLYPYDIFMKEWKQFCIYGLAVSFNLVRAMVCTTDEVFNMEDHDFEEEQSLENIKLPKLSNEAEYNRRLKSIIKHMIKNNVL